MPSVMVEIADTEQPLSISNHIVDTSQPISLWNVIKHKNHFEYEMIKMTLNIPESYNLLLVGCKWQSSLYLLSSIDI